MPCIDRVDHIHIFVTDRVKAEKWYREKLSFNRVKELEKWIEDGPLTIANGNVHLALFESKPPQKATIAFGVNHIGFKEWLAHLQQSLIKFTLVDHEPSWSMYFADPDGNPFEITSFNYNELLQLKTYIPDKAV